jgi:hypothetical protein
VWGRVSVITDVRYNPVKGYSQKYTISYIANTRNKHRSTEYDHIKVFILGYVLFYEPVQRLATGWMTERSEFDSRWGQEFSFLHVIQTGSRVHPTS